MQQDILSKFSTPAKKALIKAQVLANKIGVLRMQPEHLLASLIGQRGITAQILKKAGLRPMEIKKMIIKKQQKDTHLNLEEILTKELPAPTQNYNKEKKEVLKLPSDVENQTNITVKMKPEEREQEMGKLITDPFYKILEGGERQDINPLENKELENSLRMANLKLDSETQKVIRRAVINASRFGHKYVGSEHILAGLLEVPIKTIDNILDKSQVNHKELRERVSTILSSTSKFSEISQPAMMDHLLKQIVTGEKEETSETPALDVFAYDLTDREVQKNIDPVIGRESEIERLINILSRRTKNNPVLIGEPGVGKTAIVEGLAKKIIKGEVPDVLADKRIFNLDLGLLVAGTSFRGDFENRIKGILSEVKKRPEIILFIDEIHNMVGTGNASGAMDAANMLKPALSKGEIRFIGATTPQEYKKFIEPDPALERRLQEIFVNESNKKETLLLIEGIKKYYEKYHRVEITKEASLAAVELSERYIKNKFLPDKAIDLIDEAASRIKVKKTNQGIIKKLRELEKRKEDLIKAKEIAVEDEEFEKAIKIKEEEKALAGKIAELSGKQKKEKKKMLGKIEKNDIAEVISQITKIPTTQLVFEDKNKFLNLEEKIKEKIVSQEEAIKETANVIKKHLSGLANPDRPLGSFMFLGPSGVGKTEMARVMAEVIFNDAKALVRFDMTEFGEGFGVSKLIGAPAGYVGYRESGKLTEAIKNKPYSIVLFDEIVKAHKEVQNLLLQVLEDGKLTDATGREINFRNTIIVMTANVGLNELNKSQEIGFGQGGKNLGYDYDVVKEKVLKELKKNFGVEFLNRIDKTLVFRPLVKEDLEKIVGLQIAELGLRLRERGLGIEISDAGRKFIAKESFSPESGAREIRRKIADLVEGPLAETLLGDGFGRGVVKIDVVGGKIVLV
ncbi:ATP-dependent Clp protease ATP-binding subunit [Candidatus Falkowbacteria bacterium]|nr:ATP-dependent Clp protease ATP-binding subunit [Candidatus Falkowbacteria bacterium]